MKKDLLNQIEQQIMKEMNFYCDDKKTIRAKNERLNISLTINKLANTVIQTENLMQRASENELKAKENSRLVERFSK